MVSQDKGKLTMAPSMVSTVASFKAALSIFMKSPIWIDYTLIYVGNNTYLKKCIQNLSNSVAIVLLTAAQHLWVYGQNI